MSNRRYSGEITLLPHHKHRAAPRPHRHSVQAGCDSALREDGVCEEWERAMLNMITDGNGVCPSKYVRVSVRVYGQAGQEVCRER